MKTHSKIAVLLALVASVGLVGAGHYQRSQYQLPDEADVLRRFGRASVQVLPEQLQVLVWNVYKGRLSGWREDLQSLGADADLVLMQEAAVGAESDPLMLGIPSLEWDYAASFAYVDSERSTGVATGSRAPAQSVRYLRSPTRELVVDTPKMGLLTTYGLADGRRLLVANVHGNLSVPYEAFLAQMRAISAEIGAHTGPVLWGGDFNTWSDERLHSVTEMAAELGLYPVGFETDERLQIFGRALDHLFVRGLRVATAHTFGEVRSSDHTPMKVVFETVR